LDDVMDKRMRAQDDFPMQGRWLRARDYTIQDGHIRALGEDSEDFEEYDPWAQYYRGRQITPKKSVDKNADIPTPYMDLVRLAASLPSPGRGAHMLSEEQSATIIDWYRKHGSLGLLSQRASAAVLYPAMDLAPEEVEADDGGIEYVGVPALSQVVYMRTSRGWMRDQNYVEGSREALAGRTCGKVTVDIREPMVVMTPLDRSRPEAVALAQGWGPYFPDVPTRNAGKHPYPLPNTPEFWLNSGEPVGEYIRTARLLAKVADLGKGGSGRGILAKRRMLEAILAPAGVSVLEDSDGKLVQRWRAPSLIAMYAMMMLLDLTAENRPLRICPVCLTPFVNKRAEYCSKGCGNVARVRLHRDNVDTAWRLKQEGLSNAEIAERMAVTVEKVEGWLARSPRKG
jgi:hypothetical protein